MASVDKGSQSGRHAFGTKDRSSCGGSSSSSSERTKHRSSSSHQESSKRSRTSAMRDDQGQECQPSGQKGQQVPPPPTPCTSPDDANSFPWAIMFEAISELHDEINELKKDKDKSAYNGQQGMLGANAAPRGCEGSQGDANTSTNASHRHERVVASPLSTQSALTDSTASFSGFNAGSDEDEDGEIHDEPSIGSALLHSAKTYGPLEDILEDMELPVVDMVNYLFDHSMREEYKQIVEEEATKRPGNCHALTPVVCYAQMFDALKIEAKRTDSRMKEVSKDILMAATIIIKSLTALDKIPQDEGHAGVAQEVGMINGALALLGNTNHHNNLARRFIIKREINPKYTHLCSDKVPMTRYLFGDDVSQSARQIEESEKLRNKIAPKKSFSSWKSAASKFGGTKARGFFGRNPYRGFSSRFHPYRQRRAGFTRQSFCRQEIEPKNTRGRGHCNPRQ
ncbi:hypothetical protein E2C01_057360 [Portunus trituberculatus]|uniref:Uncharacterized protein n=1 Tax=Portunus trituberculatus TaxID=210409 RepID=A0A5B7H0U8_PORTR|nr:hypothetical protein [Portunus trituberculatus]